MGQAYPIFLIYAHGEARAVYAVGEAFTAPYIAVPDKLAGILHHVYTYVGYAFSIFDFCHSHGFLQLVGQFYVIFCHIAFIAVYLYF